MKAPNSSVKEVSSASQVKPLYENVRVVSLLPFLTDIVCELKLQHLLVGVSHECQAAEYLGGTQVAQVTSCKLDPVNRNNTSLDQTILNDTLDCERLSAVWNSIAASSIAPFIPDLSDHLCSYYHVHVHKLFHLRPTLILTQVDNSPRTPLHPSTDEICQATRLQVPSVSNILAVSDVQFATVDAVFALHRHIAKLTGHPDAADQAITQARAQLLKVTKHTRAFTRNRVTKLAVVQWPAPLYVAGGWVASLVDAVCGPQSSPLSHAGGASVHIDDGSRLFQSSTVVVFALCALDIAQTRRAVAPFVRRAIDNGSCNIRDTSLAVVDGRRLFAWLGASNVVLSAQVLDEIITGRSAYGHKGILWQPW